jgi:hypothetical protein
VVWLRLLQFPNGDLLLLNEEGKLMGLPVNDKASKLWKDTFDNDNYITGRKDFVLGLPYFRAEAIHDLG